MASVRLIFTDGRSEAVRINPRCMVEAERKYGDMSTHGYEATLYGAWFRLGRPGGNFDTWLDTIEDMEQDEEAADPTQPAASAGSSQSSP